jgi:hypothetical protein
MARQMEFNGLAMLIYRGIANFWLCVAIKQSFVLFCNFNATLSN